MSKAIVYYAKIGTVPMTINLKRRYALRPGQLVWWREDSHGAKWQTGRVTNHDPLRIDR